MKNFNQQTIADIMDVPKASITSILPFIGLSDPDLKSNWCLVDGLKRELVVLYICHRTGNFLASERLSSFRNINPLEYNKNGKYIGFSRKYDIKGKKRIS